MIWTFVIIALWLIVTFLECGLSDHTTYYSAKSQPILTDEEFVALMPDVDANVALTIRQILVDVSGWDQDEIHPETRLADFEL